jgi:hypothetical protein
MLVEAADMAVDFRLKKDGRWWWSKCVRFQVGVMSC